MLVSIWPFALLAQDKDSLQSVKTANTKDSLATDSAAINKKQKATADKFTPDTVFLINGDKFTGNIISYDQGRLKIDAQGPGIINIKWQKIYSVSGGSRVFKIEDIRKEIYTGYIRFSEDTGEIILQSKLTYGFMFPDIARLAPLEQAKDSLLPISTTEEKEKKPPVYKHSPDTVFLKTGDRIAGNIISYEQGRLKIDAQGAGVIYIKWYKIAAIGGGSRPFKVEDRRGERYIGRIEISKDTGEIDVVNALRYGVMLEDVVRIFPLEVNWIRGFKGNMGAGVNYTKSSDVLSVNVDYNLYYVISKWRFINDFSYLSTSKSNAAPSLRIQLDFEALYALHKKWLLYEINSFSKNDELGIKSRISFGAGGGNALVQTEKQQFVVLTGIIQNSETDVESNAVTSNFEWPVTLQHTIYSFIAPNITASTKVSSYVGITEKGRRRLDASTDVTWEFIKNVKLMLTAYYNFDNKTLAGKASTQDYGTVLSLSFDLK